MRLADIVVTVDPSPSGQDRVAAAIRLAARTGARLTGVYMWPTSGLIAVERAGEAAREAVAGELAEEARAAFERDAGAVSVATDWAVGERAGDVGGLIDLARAADLAVTGLPPSPGEGSDPGSFDVEALVVGAGRPVLGLPFAALPATIGRQAAVAWDGSRESARAVHDALPLLGDAVSLRIVSIGSGDGSASADRLAAHLARHGLATTIDRDHGLHLDSPAEEILARLALPEVDLLIAGAFGHSRTAERLFGGASRIFLHQMMVPVLVSH